MCTCYSTEYDLHSCVPLKLAVLNNRIDVAKMMVTSGADPIEVPDPDSFGGVTPIIDEYSHFGTNRYLKWLLNEHLNPNEVESFIQKLLDISVHKPDGDLMVSIMYAHALLTCGHEKMAKTLLEHPNHGGVSLLNEKDAAGFTALQVAANHGDMEPFKVLLQL